MFSVSSSPRRSSSTLNLTCTALTMALVTSVLGAQQTQPTATLPDSPVAQQSRSQPNSGVAADTVTIPAGTRLPLVLTHPLDSKTTHHGDEIHAQISAPITLDHRVAIPAGTFMQGKVAALKRDGSRALITLQSASLAFTNGYVTNVRGPLEVMTEEGTAWNDPTTATKTAAIIAPFAGSGIGLAVSSSFHDSSSLGGMTITSPSPKALGIGSLIGLGAGGAISLILLARSHYFYLQEGSAMQTSLPLPVTLSASQITAANDAPQATPPAIRSNWPSGCSKTTFRRDSGYRYTS